MPDDGRVPHLLIVDDEWMNREMLTAVLKLEGYRVSAANSGPQGLEIAFHDPPDLVLLDILMNEMDGYEVCRKLKDDDRTRHASVLMISGVRSDEDVERARQVGAADLVMKPFQITQILGQIKNLLEQPPA